MKFRDIKKFPHSNYHVDVGLDHLKTHLDRYEKSFGLILQPDYQRGYVWTRNQQIAWLEYLFRGGTSGREIYFNSPNWMGHTEQHPVECVDGQQRIGACLAFLNDEVPIFGHLLSEFKDKMPVFEPRLSVHINNLTDRKEIIEWYLSLNTGGSYHSEEDLKPAYEALEQL